MFIHRMRGLAFPAVFVVAFAALGGVSEASCQGPGILCDLGTHSGETLNEGRWEFTFRWDHVWFENLSDEEIEARTRALTGHAHVNAIRWSTLQTFAVAYGLTDKLQVSLSSGFYRADDLREGHLHGDGSFGLHERGDVSGMTDLWLRVKYGVSESDSGAWALMGGIKFPTGRDDVEPKDSTHNIQLEPSLQPGSGAFDFQGGAAHTRRLSDRHALDVSLLYTHRTEGDFVTRHDGAYETHSYKIGDRADASVGYTFRPEGRAAFTAELLLRHAWRDKEEGETLESSGGTTVFLAPGVRVRVRDGAWWSFGVQVPVHRNLNGGLQETNLQAMTALTFRR